MGLMDWFHMMTCRDRHCRYCNNTKEPPMIPGPPPDKSGDEEQQPLPGLEPDLERYTKIQRIDQLSQILPYNVLRFFEQLNAHLKGHSTQGQRQIKEAPSWRGASLNGRKSKFKRRSTSLPTHRGKYTGDRHD